MGHRHRPNSINRFEMEQGHNRNPLTAGQSYTQMGRAVTPENGSFVHPVDNMARDGIQCPPRWISENRTNDFPPPYVGADVLHFRPDYSGPTYDAVSQSSAAGNLYQNPDYDSYYNRHGIRETGGMDPVMDTSRGRFKRKDPSVSLAYERGSTSRFYGEGSSSGSSEPILEKPSSSYQNIPSYPFGLPHRRDGGSSFSGEGSSRNVRSRSRLDMEAGSMRTHLSRFPSHRYHSTSHPGAVQLTSMNVDETTRGWNSVPPPPVLHDTIGMNHMSNQCFASGSATEIGAPRHDSVRSRNPFSSPRYSHGPPIQDTRGVRNNNFRRAIPSSRAGLSYTRSGPEASYSESGPQSSAETYSSRYSRPLSGGVLHNSYRSARSGVAIERLQPISSIVDAHDRMGSEGLSTVEHSSSYAGFRSLFDQYGDMRLDIDNMSYEELLDLGERIGNVSMGLSEYVISTSLSEEIHYSSGQIREEESCAICLEEYENGDKVGIVKNCGHDYHAGCIKKWLSMKNVCPICKAPAIEDTLKAQ